MRDVVIYAYLGTEHLLIRCRLAVRFSAYRPGIILVTILVLRELNAVCMSELITLLK